MISATRPEADDEEGEQQFATQLEAREAIEQLKNEDHAKLMLIARGFARTRLRGTAVSPSDLLQDAIAKTLDGRRRWNRRVTIIKHLDRIMESDAGHEAASRASRGTRQMHDGDAERASTLPLAETRLLAIDEFDGLLVLFKDDQAAIDLLRLKASEVSAAEIQRELGMDKG